MTTRPRFSLAVVVVLAVTLGLTDTTALAQPGDVPDARGAVGPERGGENGELPEDFDIPRVPPDEISAFEAESYARDHDVDVEVARQRLSDQLLMGEVRLRAFRDHPNTFAGSFIDGEQMIMLFTDAPDERLESVLDSEMQPLDIQAQAAAYSHRELVARMEGLAAELAATFGPTDYVVLIDEVNNRVEVELSEETRRTTEGVGTAEGIAADPMIELDPEPLEIEQIACVNRDNCTPYRSGLALDLFDTDSSASDPCSSGFAARNAAGARYLLTAGHCVFNAGGSNNSGVNVYSPVGTFVGGIPSTGWYDNDNVRVDAARIYLGSSGSRASVYQDNAYKDLRVGGVAWASSTGATQMQIGNYLCKAGRSTGGSCGTVDAVFIAANGDNGQFRISGPNACALGGDSGAGVYGSSIAWGNAVYSNRSTACSSAPYFGGSHADFIESVLDITIETR